MANKDRQGFGDILSQRDDIGKENFYFMHIHCCAQLQQLLTWSRRWISIDILYSHSPPLTNHGLQGN